MKTVDPKFLARSREVFVSVAGMTLQELRDRVAAEAAGTARRDMLSALDTLARWFGRPLTTILATPSAIRELFGNTSGPQLGIRAKRFANVRADVGKALRLYGAPVSAITKRIPFSPAWMDLLNTVAITHHRMALYRLASFCSAMSVAPVDVGADVLVGLHCALEAEEIVKNPRKLLNTTIAIWNMCRRGVLGWPDITLSSPFKTQPFALPLSTFPDIFQKDVATWVTRVTNPDPTDDDAPSRPLRAITVHNRINEFRRFASALVHLGILKIEEVVGLDVFFERDHFKAGLRHFVGQPGNKPTEGLAAMAKHLRHVALHHCKVSPETLKDLTKACNNLASRVTHQFSERNRERLRQFDDPKKVAALMAFPAEERARGLKERNPFRAAKCMERALAVDILIHFCLRIGNLCSIHLTKHLRHAGGKTYLNFEPGEVKNSQRLDFELPEDLAIAVEEFCRVYRPRMPGAGGKYLFPGSKGGARYHSSMRKAIEDALRKRSGLIMHPHLFRHAIGKIVVERDPDMYVAFSQMLGHKRLQTLLASYIGTETRSSARHIDRLLHQARVDPKLKKD